MEESAHWIGAVKRGRLATTQYVASAIDLLVITSFQT